MIEVGQIVPDIAITNYDSTGALADATTVVVTVTLPDQTTATPSVNHPSTGVYYSNYVPIQAGPHSYTWVLTGTNANVHSDSFYVENTRTSIVSLSEVKSHLRILTSNDDEILRLLSLEASDLAESAEGTNRLWRLRTITGETMDAGGTYIQLRNVPVTKLIAVRNSGVTMDLTTLDYQLPSTTGIITNATGFSSGGRDLEISVDYQAGAVTTIPAGVRIGVLELVRHLYAMHRGGSQLPRQGDPDTTYSLGVGYLIPNRVAMAFRAHRASGIG